MGCEIIFLQLWFRKAFVIHIDQFGKAKRGLRKFRKGKKGLRNSLNFVRSLSYSMHSCWPFRKTERWVAKLLMLDSFSDSLPYTLDWFGKGFKALQWLDFSCNLASILLCHGLYQVLPHSWLVLMIKKLSKTSKLAKKQISNTYKGP